MYHSLAMGKRKSDIVTVLAITLVLLIIRFVSFEWLGTSFWRDVIIIGTWLVAIIVYILIKVKD